MKKENLVWLMSKYNAQFVSVVGTMDENFGSALVGDNHIYFDVKGDGVLYVYDVIDKDNIHLYYEFMSDDDLKRLNYDIMNDIFEDRYNAVRPFLNLPFLTWSTSSCSEFTFKKERLKSFSDNFAATKWRYTNIYLSIFGIKDTLKPIYEYIKEIKASKEYIAYIMPTIPHNLSYRTVLNPKDDFFILVGTTFRTFNSFTLKNGEKTYSHFGLIDDNFLSKYSLEKEYQEYITTEAP